MTYRDLKVVVLAIFGVVLMAVPGVAAAEDLLVVCVRDGDCSMSPDDEPLFDEDDLKPGDSIRRNFEIRNEKDEECTLIFVADETKQDPNDFADRLFTLIEEGSHDWYGQGDSNVATNSKNLDDLYGDDPIGLGVIGSQETRNFKWVVTFDRDAGNEYQNAETKFDFDMNFECDSVPQVNGIVSGIIGKVLGDEFTRFPGTGGESQSSIAQGQRTLRKVLVLFLSFMLSVYVVFRIRREKLARS